MEVLTSRQNPLCKKILRLRTSRSFRYEQKLFLADGVKLVNEAIKWKADIETIVFCEGTELQSVESCHSVMVSDELMRYISSMDTPQGALAVIRMPEVPRSLPDGPMMILDHIQDPGNLGTILRTADALNVPVVLSEGCADPYNEKTVRASMGAVFRTPVYRAEAEEIIHHCRNAGIPILTTELHRESIDVRDADLLRAAIVVGNEGHGISVPFSRQANKRILIPMSDRCESLNASVAASILLWQLYNAN